MAEGKRRPTAVLGIGNTLYGDDGFGPRVAGVLAQRGLGQGVDIVDAGSIGVDLIDYFTGYRRVVIVDAAEMGLEPGTLRIFTPDQVRSLKRGSPLSLHSTDILAVIDLANALNLEVADIHVVAVQPEFVGPREGLSAAVEAALDAAAEEARRLSML